MESSTTLPIVGDVRGDGYFYAVELVKDKATKQTLARRGGRVLRATSLAPRSRTALYCRIEIAATRSSRSPPLICGQAEFDEMEQVLRHVLTKPDQDRALPVVCP